MRLSQVVSAALAGLAVVAWLAFVQRPTRDNLVRALLRTSALR
jgi:hypothetical protein